MGHPASPPGLAMCATYHHLPHAALLLTRGVEPSRVLGIGPGAAVVVEHPADPAGQLVAVHYAHSPAGGARDAATSSARG
jgi:hypothetical protein